MCLKWSCPVDCTTSLTCAGLISARPAGWKIHYVQQLPRDQHNTDTEVSMLRNWDRGLTTDSFNHSGVINNTNPQFLQKKKEGCGLYKELPPLLFFAPIIHHKFLPARFSSWLSRRNCCCDKLIGVISGSCLLINSVLALTCLYPVDSSLSIPEQMLWVRLRSSKPQWFGACWEVVCSVYLRFKMSILGHSHILAVELEQKVRIF